MTIKVDEDNLKQGVLGLVVALVEIIRDALRLQATRRIESGKLTDEEVERLGEALADLDTALEDLKEEQEIEETTQNVRDGLDDIASDVVDKLVNPERWAEAEQRGVST